MGDFRNGPRAIQYLPAPLWVRSNHRLCTQPKRRIQIVARKRLRELLKVYERGERAMEALQIEL
jgi:hypothetical protein